MLQALFGLLGRAALDAEDDVARALVLHGLDDPVPVQHAFTARATDRCSRYLATFGGRMFVGDVLGV